MREFREGSPQPCPIRAGKGIEPREGMIDRLADRNRHALDREQIRAQDSSDPIVK